MWRFLAVGVLLSWGTTVAAAERTITVNGTGVAKVEPDRALIRLSIVARDPELSSAQKAAANVTNKVLKLIDDLDIPREQADTTGASVRADYRWNRDKEEQELRGYIAERQIVVEIRDLEKLGAVVEGAVEAGVNQVSPPQLESSQRRQTYRAALHAAAVDAKANATQLAQALGATVGKVNRVNAGVDLPGGPEPRPMMRAMSADAGAAESYNAADLSFTAKVTVVFELLD